MDFVRKKNHNFFIDLAIKYLEKEINFNFLLSRENLKRECLQNRCR